MDDSILKQIQAHAAREFPREACGLIINGGVGHYLVECENLSHDAQHSFLIDPLVYHANVDRIAAVYHSHPNRSPQPSQADIASSERCAVPFLIMGYPTCEVFTYIPGNYHPGDYEGREFVYGVMDCLSLVVDYYCHELGIIITQGERKQWGWWLDTANYHAFINGWEAAGFQKVDKPQKQDLVIMALRAPCPNHVAIYMGENTILHHPSLGAPSRLEMYGHYWQSNTVCFMRYVDEAN